MSSINNITGSNAVQRLIDQPIQRALSTDRPTPTKATDRLELSGHGHLLQALKSNDVRIDKVADIRAQLASGKYDENGKLDSVLDKVLDDLAK
jgi:anti-sigma28 factor (negative regulator of flagellin synthesis)